MRVLVCGGRDFTDYQALSNVLGQVDGTVGGIHLLIHGAAPGADTLAELWAKRCEVAYAGYPAKWRREGRGAGPARNRRMLYESRPELVIAFPTVDSTGTWDMVHIAQVADLPVFIADGNPFREWWQARTELLGT